MKLTSTSPTTTTGSKDAPNNNIKRSSPLMGRLLRKTHSTVASASTPNLQVLHEEHHFPKRSSDDDLHNEETEPPISVPPPSPGSHKKVWERKYGHFLKRHKQQKNNSANSTSPLSTSSSMSSLGGGGGGGGDHSSEEDSSVRGGKLFANVFRGGGNDSSSSSSPRSGGRRHSGHRDELDMPVRRGETSSQRRQRQASDPAMLSRSNQRPPISPARPKSELQDPLDVARNHHQQQRHLLTSFHRGTASMDTNGLILDATSGTHAHAAALSASALALQLPYMPVTSALATRPVSLPHLSGMAEGGAPVILNEDNDDDPLSEADIALAKAISADSLANQSMFGAAPPSPLGCPPELLRPTDLVWEQEGNTATLALPLDSSPGEYSGIICNGSNHAADNYRVTSGWMLSMQANGGSSNQLNDVPPSPPIMEASSSLKMAFTEFHNAQATGQDAMSAFLDEDWAKKAQDVTSLAWTQNHALAAAGSTMSVPSHLYKLGGVNSASLPESLLSRQTASVGLVAPSPSSLTMALQGTSADSAATTATAAGDHSSVAVSVHPTLRILKPVQGVESWQSGRRYLIAPAAMASCPLSVLRAVNHERNMVTAVEAAADTSTNSLFGSICLGPCLLSYKSVGSSTSTATIVNKQFSRTILVLRQNFLLEYDNADSSVGDSVRSLSASSSSYLPRGVANLQFAACRAHEDFKDAIWLEFFGSPCAKADRRVLMIRIIASGKDQHGIEHRRQGWIDCLNRAAKLQIDDLYEYDSGGGSVLGHGQCATVYKARRRQQRRDTPPGTVSESDGHHCALKVFDKKEFWKLVVKNRERADTLVREASVQATLTAKCAAGGVASFVRLQCFFETSEYVVMEFELLEGTDLFQFISSRSARGSQRLQGLSEPDAARIMRDILQCLEAMNRNGLAHRDVKPANILMCESRPGDDSTCRVKVGDFGMSTFVGVDGQVRGRCGTPGYVAPEIFSAGDHSGYGNKVDVFSAGVTLYVMLCGYEPFYGETDAELVQANKQARIEFPTSDWKHISDQAKELVRRMMHPNPSLRLSAKDALSHEWFRCHLKQKVAQPSTLTSQLASVSLNGKAASPSRHDPVCVIL